MELSLGLGKGAVRVSRGRKRLNPAVRQTSRQDFSQQRFPTRLIAMTSRSRKRVQIEIGSEVDRNQFLPVPVGRDLEDRGSADAVVREEQFFSKCFFPAGCGDNHLGRDSSEIAPALEIGLAKDKRNQGGARRLDLQAKLPCQVITKRSGADLCDR